MNKPQLSLLALTLIAPLLAGGCTLYANPSLCKTQMRDAVANAKPSATLSISNVGVGIDGSRVVVEGTLETAAAPADTSVSEANPSAAKSNANPATKKKVKTPAAVECTFKGDKLAALRWLSPPELAQPASSPVTEDTE